MDTIAKVLFILADYPALGGIAKLSRQLSAYLQSQHYAVDILAMCKDDRALPSWGIAPEHLYYLPQKNDFNAAENRVFTQSLIFENHYDFVINQGIVSLSYKDFEKESTPKFINVWHGCPQWLFLRKHQRSWKDVLSQKNIKALARYALVKLFPAWDHRRIKKQLKAEIEQSAAYVVLTDAYKKELEQMLYHGVAQDKIKVIPNPVEPSSLLSKKQKVVLYAGRFSRADKRLDRLLRIWAKVENQVPDWRLQLIGEGPDEAALKHLAESLHLHRVSFVPTIWDDSLYAEASVFAMTSSYEGFNLALMEAQQAGMVPIAYSSTASFSEIVHHGVSGFLIPPFEEQVYVDYLMALLTEDDRRATMSEAAIRQVSTFRIERIGILWLNLLKTLKS